MAAGGRLQREEELGRETKEEKIQETHNLSRSAEMNSVMQGEASRRRIERRRLRPDAKKTTSTSPCTSSQLGLLAEEEEGSAAKLAAASIWPGAAGDGGEATAGREIGRAHV